MPVISRIGSRFIKNKVIHNDLPVGYTLTEGIKAPVGSAGMTVFNTNATSGSTDDGFSARALPFSVNFYGTSYSTVFIGTNTYLTFTAGATNYSSLSLGPTPIPALPAIHIGSADNSSSTSYFLTGTNVYRLRYEGWSSTSVGSGTQIIYEIRFFRQVTASDDIFIEIVIGTHGRTGGIWGITNGATPATSTSFAALTMPQGNVGSSSALAQNKSYVLILNSNGGFKNLYSGYYVSSVVT
jgi:hypothetical protein